MKRLLTLIGLMVALTLSTGCGVWDDITDMPDQSSGGDTINVPGDGNHVEIHKGVAPELTPTPVPEANPNQAGFGFIQLVIVVLIMLSGSGCAFSIQGPAHLALHPTASLYNRGGTIGNDQAHSADAAASTGEKWIETEGGGSAQADVDTDVNSSAETTKTTTTTEEPAEAQESEEGETEEKPAESLIVGADTFEPLDEDPTAEEVNADQDSYLNFAGRWYRKVSPEQ